jgi:ORF6N domain
MYRKTCIEGAVCQWLSRCIACNGLVRNKRRSLSAQKDAQQREDIDRDLAKLYGVETKVLKQAVKRNIRRFPDDFMFVLTIEETQSSRSQFVTLNARKMQRGQNIKYTAMAFTEQGVAMISTVLKSELAIAISIEIMKVFVHLRNRLQHGVFFQSRLDSMEMRIELQDLKIDTIMAKTTENQRMPQHGIFFENKIFDAYVFFCDIVQRAQKSIILIDNYIDHTVLLQFAKRGRNVSATIYTERISATLQLDLAKHNAQYAPIEIQRIKQVHDRFLLIDEKELYHIGASIKDLGKRWFAFSRMDSLAGEIIKKLSANC